MADKDLIQQWELQQTVDRLEAAIANGAVASDALPVLVRFIGDAKRKIGMSSSEEGIVDKERRQKADQAAVISCLMQRERGLTDSEREQYGALLSRAFFCKTDFDELEKFYAGPWDRLSERGKDEMSTRVWEGVRRDEYRFSELPVMVKEKEASRLHDLLTVRPRLSPELERIPLEDREEFVNARRVGQNEASYRILNRASCTENVSVSSRQIVPAQAVSNTGRQATRENAEGESTRRQADGTKLLGDVLLRVEDVPTVEIKDLKAPLPGVSAGSHSKLGRE